MRIATAIAAVVGIWAMASQEASSQPLPLDIADGTYLYGESPVAETLGATYFVFEVTDNTLAGVVYQPSSSFDCVYGTVTADALNLTIVNAYDQSEWQHTVALVPATTEIASLNGTAPPPQLEGMHAIRTISELDQQLLATCTQR